MIKFHEFFLTFFYLGKIKKAPGTLGSFGCVILWLLISKFFSNHQISLFWQNVFWTAFLSIIIVYAISSIPTYAKKVGQLDHKSIVIDEVVGQILTLQITFTLIYKNYFLQNDLILLHSALCFIFFRFFDIKKPFLIGYYDRNLKSAFGVIFDDILAGIAATVVVATLLTLLKA